MKYIKVKFLKAHPAFAYSAGNIGSLTEENAAKLLNAGYIIILPEDGEEGVENTLPADLPARDALFAEGFDTLEKIKKAGEGLLDVAGVSKASYKKIVGYLEKDPA